jgi:putative NADH-flavin reductase
LNDKAHHIRERFPNKSHIIDLLILEDAEFVALCEDYDACVDALHYWAKSKASEAETRVNEYRTLIEELEEEITQVLVTV